jgi:hypothetical protein
MDSKQLSILRHSEKMTLYRVYPWYNNGERKALPPEQLFNGWDILKQIDIKQKMDRVAIAKIVSSEISESSGLSANCFMPRHAIRAVRGKQRLDLLICFACHNMLCYLNGKDIGGYCIASKSADQLNSFVQATPAELRQNPKVIIRATIPPEHALAETDLKLQYDEFVSSDTFSSIAEAIGHEPIRRLHPNMVLTKSDVGLVEYSKPGSSEKLYGSIAPYIAAIRKSLSTHELLQNRCLELTVHRDGKIDYRGELLDPTNKKRLEKTEVINILEGQNVPPLPDWYPDTSLNLNLEIPDK